MRACIVAMALKRYSSRCARRLQDIDHRARDLRPDPIAWNQGNPVRLPGCRHLLPPFLRVFSVEQLFQLGLELSNVFEVAIDARESDIGNCVDTLRPSHYHLAHLARRSFTLPPS